VTGAVLARVHAAACMQTIHAWAVYTHKPDS
jgi:hypothetical protein